MAKPGYWELRQAQNMYEYMQSAEEVSDQIAKLYLKASIYINKQADDIFEKFMTKYELTEDEALELLNTLQDKASVEELLQKLWAESNNKNKKEFLERLESLAYRTRLERLQQIQTQLDYVMNYVYQQEKTLSTAHYIDLASEAYYRGIYDIQQRVGTAFSFGYVDPKVIDQVIGSRWSGKNYSERIWGNTRALAQSIKEELLLNLVTGRTNREAALSIQTKFAAGASAARRLVRTESNYIATELDFKAYEEAGIEKYQFLATLDLRTSEVCRKLDNKIFWVKDKKTGTNCPPMHPWCRSTTIEVVDEELMHKLTRRARDPVTGHSLKVSGDMNYSEWYQKYVKGKPEAELAEKQIKNRASDRKQHKEYRSVLGSEVPEKLDDFQRMKYTDRNRWNELKEAYRDVNWQRKALENHSTGEVHKVPYTSTPNSVFDNYENGKLVQRRYYGRTGKPRLDIDLTDHGNSKKHSIVPHRHGWEELRDGSMKRSEKHDMPLKLGDKIANRDILKGGNENG